jgi:hypothetical protein
LASVTEMRPGSIALEGCEFSTGPVRLSQVFAKNKNAGLVGPAASLLFIGGERLVYVSVPADLEKSPNLELVRLKTDRHRNSIVKLTPTRLAFT